MDDFFDTCSGSPRLLKEVLASVRHGILVADFNGRIALANPPAHELLGYPPDGLLGQNLAVLFTPEDQGLMVPNLLALAEREESFSGEVMLRRKDEGRFFALISLGTCLDPEAGRSALILTLQDVDRQKKMEKALVGSYYQDLVKMADGIAHELRNPLVGIGGFVERLYKSCPTGPDHDTYYYYVLSNLRKIENLVRKVEFFARLPRPVMGREPIRGLIDRALEPHRREIKERRIELHTVADDTVLFADPELLVRALSILIENALDALPEGGRLQITTEAGDRTCGIVVQDRGSGIAPEHLPFVFNPFFSTKADGAGIDLAIVKRIVEAHGGDVELRSEKGKGTTVSLRLPRERRRMIRIGRLEGETNQPR